MESSDAIKLFLPEPVLQQRLAKLIVLECFRNSALEDLHAGISPDSAAGDYSNVLVNSPYGAIPWQQVSRFNDEEMKKLMIDVVDRTYQFVHRLFDEAAGGVLLLSLAERDPVPHWQTPMLRNR
jgi:ligand-binding SRPBCC domain-containing protein